MGMNLSFKFTNDLLGSPSEMAAILVLGNLVCLKFQLNWKKKMANLPNISTHYNQTEKKPKMHSSYMLAHHSINHGLGCVTSVIWQLTITALIVDSCYSPLKLLTHNTHSAMLPILGILDITIAVPYDTNPFWREVYERRRQPPFTQEEDDHKAGDGDHHAEEGNHEAGEGDQHAEEVDDKTEEGNNHPTTETINSMRVTITPKREIIRPKRGTITRRPGFKRRCPLG